MVNEGIAFQITFSHDLAIRFLIGSNLKKYFYTILFWENQSLLMVVNYMYGCKI